MNSKDIGDFGESKAVDYLVKEGFEIIDRNWKNRWCEIDVIAKKRDTLYFIEVKYRKNNVYGDGVDAITDKKLKKMIFASEFWVYSNKWVNDYALAAIAVSPDSINFIEIY